MPTSNDRPEPRQFVRRLNESPATTTPVMNGTTAPAGPRAGTRPPADLVEEFERWDGLS